MSRGESELQRPRGQVHTAWNKIVMMNVCMGLILGRTAKIVSPTSPLEVDATPGASAVKFFATIQPRHQSDNATRDGF